MLYSPLRYPGGKNKLSSFIAKICLDNGINGHYVEPYSGGSSVALFLLLEGFVERITINDKDRSIYAFWHSVLNQTEALCNMIENTDITIEVWRQQKQIQQNKDRVDLLSLGFSTFFLSRTNRSGIIKGGVIGGNGQIGKYLIDCRFNKKELIERIKTIAAQKKNIRLYKKDAVQLIAKIQKEADITNTIFYFDPPYFLKADSLYMNHYKKHDHDIVSKKIRGIKNIKWIVSYDNVVDIKRLYHGYPKKEYSFTHTAGYTKQGQEILFFSKGLIQPDVAPYDPTFFRLNRKSRKIYYRKRRTRKKNNNTLV